MRVALLSTGFLAGKEATAITLTDYADYLANRGDFVTIISEMRKEDNRLEKKENIEIYRIGFSGKNKKVSKFSIYNRILAHALAVKRMQKKCGKKFDVIHGFSAAPVLVLRTIFAKLFSRKAITVQTLKSYSREKIGRRMFKLLNYVDLVTVPSNVFASHLIEKGVKKEKIKVIRSHINLDKFKPADKELKEELKGKYGFSGKRVIFYYGSMWEMKGTDVLMKIIPEVLRRNKDVIFVFAPRNLPYANKYKSEYKGYEDRVIMIEETVKIEDYVALADLVVLPYVSMIGTEGNPSCMLEAMACKTAVVTTDLPELREIADKCVFMAKPGDESSLVMNILIAVQNPNKEMIEEAYLRSKEFSIENVCENFLNIYQSCMTKNI